MFVDCSEENVEPQEPIDYEKALAELMAKRRRQRWTAPFKRIDLRPSSPGQVALVGIILAVVGWLVPGLHVASLAGLILLLVGFLTGLMQPRGRRVVWRNREIDLPGRENWAARFYRMLYRH